MGGGYVYLAGADWVNGDIPMENQSDREDSICGFVYIKWKPTVSVISKYGPLSSHICLRCAGVSRIRQRLP